MREHIAITVCALSALAGAYFIYAGQPSSRVLMLMFTVWWIAAETLSNRWKLMFKTMSGVHEASKAGALRLYGTARIISNGALLMLALSVVLFFVR
jgi:hypothetical protein